MKKSTTKAKPRARELGLRFEGRPGANNAITDVPGVEVGMFTRIDPDHVPGRTHTPVRTGVTAIFPCGRENPDRSVWAANFSFNGNGEMTGTHWVNDAGHFSGPIAITNSHSVGMVHHGMVRWMVDKVPAMTTHHHWYLPVVAETYDGLTNDINGLHITEANVAEALNSAKGGPVSEGNVGGGTGMMCYEFKGGTGTSSRQVEIEGETYTVGVLIQTNFGSREELQVMGVPVGRLWPEIGPLTALGQGETGSAIIIIATDAPLNPLQLRRLAKRGSFGLARTGTSGGVNSGDLMLAFTTNSTRQWSSAEQYYGNAVKNIACLEDNLTDALHRATVLATEEAVLNALCAAEDMAFSKPEGYAYKAIDTAKLVEILGSYRALDGL